MNRFTAFLIVVALWAAVYLPGLGSTEIKGEEGRRILPAVTMLDGGSWLVPYVGGKPFLRKPPLVNWMIALSFKMLDRRDEWAARLPSALAVLALCGVMLAVSGPRARTIWTTDVAFIAAMFVLTQFGLLAKARFAGAEIEGIYVPLAGMGVVTWLAWWEQRRSAWLVWAVPFVFLGMAALAKGPTHLLFFYAIVVAVLWQAGETRQLMRAPHFAGLAIMVGIFACWAIPYFSATTDALKVWQDQMAGRVTENKFDATSYVLNIPRGLGDQLPWMLFAPVLWARRTMWSGREGAMVRGTIYASVACFIGLLLVPGALTRYVLPLGVPFAMLLAMALGDEKLPSASTALRLWWRANSGLACGVMLLAVASPASLAVAEWRGVGGGRLSEPAIPLVASAVAMSVGFVIFARRRSFARPTRIAGASVALCGASSFLYGAIAVPFITRADNIRPLAAAIDGMVPPGKRLFIFDPEYQPAIFYLRSQYQYSPAMKDLPDDAEYVMARAGNLAKLQRERPELQLARDFGGSDKNRVLLLQRRPEIPNDPVPEVVP